MRAKREADLLQRARRRKDDKLAARFGRTVPQKTSDVRRGARASGLGRETVAVSPGASGAPLLVDLLRRRGRGNLEHPPGTASSRRRRLMLHPIRLVWTPAPG